MVQPKWRQVVQNGVTSQVRLMSSDDVHLLVGLSFWEGLVGVAVLPWLRWLKSINAFVRDITTPRRLTAEPTEEMWCVKAAYHIRRFQIRRVDLLDSWNRNSCSWQQHDSWSKWTRGQTIINKYWNNLTLRILSSFPINRIVSSRPINSKSRRLRYVSVSLLNFLQYQDILPCVNKRYVSLLSLNFVKYQDMLPCA